MAEEIKDYTPELQKLFVETLISDPETYSRCQNILSHTYFEQPFLEVSCDCKKSSYHFSVWAYFQPVRLPKSYEAAS